MTTNLILSIINGGVLGYAFLLTRWNLRRRMALIEGGRALERAAAKQQEVLDSMKGMEDVLDALEGMVEQYLGVYPGNGEMATEFHHEFMSAGEFACEVLAAARPERWERTAVGLRRHD